MVQELIKMKSGLSVDWRIQCWDDCLKVDWLCWPIGPVLYQAHPGQKIKSMELPLSSITCSNNSACEVCKLPLLPMQVIPRVSPGIRILGVGWCSVACQHVARGWEQKRPPILCTEGARRPGFHSTVWQGGLRSCTEIVGCCLDDQRHDVLLGMEGDMPRVCMRLYFQGSLGCGHQLPQ